MNEKEMQAAINGFFAYESGCVDSGIKDDARKARIKMHLHTLSDNDLRVFLARMVREACLCEEAIEQGYGAEDAFAFLKWLEEWLGDLF